MPLMLRTLLAFVLLGVLVPLPSHADEADSSAISWVNVAGRGTVHVGIEAPSFSSAGSSEASGSRGTGGSSGDPGCYTREGIQVPCRQFGGIWNTARNCYARPQPQQPPHTDPAWAGNTTGIIMECARGDMGGWHYTWQWWQPDATTDPTPPPDPRELAQRAIDSMQLQPITMGIYPRSTDDDPDALGYVGWNVWLWAQHPSPATWGPITATASTAGHTVTATASASRVTWHMGNTDTVTCTTGTPWNPLYTRNEPSPTCGYTYQQPGHYTITATTHWTVDWSGIGQTGTIPLELDDTRNVTIAEIQVVNTTGRHR